MKIFRFFSLLCISCIMFHPVINGQKLSIVKLEMNFPVPGIPYYHLKADLELSQSSMIDVEIAVDGKTLRYPDLYPEHDLGNLSYPHIAWRSPSGAGLSRDNKLYQNPSIVGWVKWEPGKTYDIKVSVRMKKNVIPDPKDLIITASQKVTAPAASVFDPAWGKYKSIVLSETAGIDRVAEPVEVLLPFYPDELEYPTKEIRVVAYDPATKTVKEVPSQVYDIQKYLVEDDMSVGNGLPERDDPIWLPTLSARVAFFADVPARSSRIYLVYYGNKNAMFKSYITDLQVKGDAPGLIIDNNLIQVAMHPLSGHFDQLILKSKPDQQLFHRLETNGAIHWTPEVYSPPSPWTHASDWDPPENVNFTPGPVISFAEMWGPLRYFPKVDASTRYEFFAGKPYFISSTNTRFNETVNVLALRNAEISFKRELITHAAWYDAVRGEIIEYDVVNMPELMDVKMSDDIPWITFYNKETGIGFAGIQLKYSNDGVENRTRTLNPYFYITAGPWIYWARALTHPFLSSNMQQMLPVLKGNTFTERWAYLLYEAERGEQTYKAILEWQKKLTAPLRIQLVEDVDERVSRVVTEIYIEEGKTGWDGRDTKLKKIE